jgi:hypothetical protein
MPKSAANPEPTLAISMPLPTSARNSRRVAFMIVALPRGIEMVRLAPSLASRQWSIFIE